MLATTDSRHTTAEAEHTFREKVGPRVIGGLYRVDGVAERVAGIHYGPDARAALGWDTGWAITVLQSDGALRTHCTGWSDSCGSDITQPLTGEQGMAFRVDHESVPLHPLYSRAESARAHITHLVRRETPGAVLVWAPTLDEFDDPDVPAEAHILRPGRLPVPTGYVVTPQELLDEYDPDADE